MAETMTLEFRGAQMECGFARLGSLQDDVYVPTAIGLRQQNTIASVKSDLHDTLAQMSGIVAQHRRFCDHLQWLKEHPAQ